MERKNIQSIDTKQSTGLAGLSKPTRRAFKLKSGAVVYGVHTATAPSDFSSLAVHPLNPRNQDDLDLDSIRDLASIATDGIIENAITIVNQATGKAEIIEGSRRFFGANHYKVSFPHWKITSTEPLSNADINGIIQSISEKKKISYRERGRDLPALKEKNGFTNAQLAEHLGLGEETTRKLLVAASIDVRLIKAFPDCNGIPNTYYKELAAIEEAVNGFETDLESFIEKSKASVSLSESATIEEFQEAILKALKNSAKELSKPANNEREAVKFEPILTFKDKKKSAKIKVDKEKRTVQIALTRLDNELIEEIEKLIIERCKDQ